MSDTLPPLPEPAVPGIQFSRDDPDSRNRGLYTADQMRSYAAAALAAAEPAYRDSTPHLNVGNSAFESWFQAQPFATQIGIKQISRDSYAAGMGDPLVVAAAVAEPVAWMYEYTYSPESPEDAPMRVAVSFHQNKNAPELAKHTPLYAAPAAPPQREREPLTDEQVFASEDFMTTNALYWGLPLETIMQMVRCTERAHGISAPASAPKEQA